MLCLDGGSSPPISTKFVSMNIAVVGIGYVGLVSASCFAEMGANVFCVDIDKNKIAGLNKGILPIYEEGLQEIVNKNLEDGRLHFTDSLSSCIDDVEIVFIAVGTPQKEDGRADISAVLSVAYEFGQNIRHYTLLVTKSTVPVGTSLKVREKVEEALKERSLEIEFDVASNPEFLKEGVAIKDFMTPDRVIIGCDSEKAKSLMISLYRPFLLNNFRVIFMDIASAEMTKYVSNAMLATRISFMNEVARLCELTGADVANVRKGVAADSRIGSKFLYPGCGYGGSCFPKDINALITTAEDKGLDMNIIKAVDKVNAKQKEIVFEKLSMAFSGKLQGRTIAVWGLSFKPSTDDMREAPSIVTVNHLLAAGAKVKVFDPAAMDTALRIFGDRVEYCNDIYDAAEKADAVALITEWKQFRIPDFDRIRESMNDNVIVDGRNIYDPKEIVSKGFRYYCIGRNF